MTAREKWNRRYAEPGFVPFPDKPADWLVENRGLLPSGGQALDLACGDGRNSRYLAERGFAVDAFDVSDVAIDALRAASRWAIDARAVDLESEPLPEARYDVVVSMNYLQRDLFPGMSAAVRPGGVLVLETFGEAHVNELGNRLDGRFVLARNELLRAFPGLVVRHFREGVVLRAGRPRGVAGIVAQRPPSD